MYTHCQSQENVEGRHEHVWSPFHYVDGVMSDFAIELMMLCLAANNIRSVFS